MASPFLLPSIFFTLLSLLSTITLATCEIEPSQMTCKDPNNDLIFEVQQMQLEIAQLESTLEQTKQTLDMRFRHLKEKEKLIDEMTNKIDYLRTVLANLKVASKHTEERTNALEEEVRHLWAASRKNNFAIHNLESKAQSVDDRFQVVSKKVAKMEDIVTEQWIQIRQLDQALKVVEMRNLKAARREALKRCTFLKLINGICEHYLPKYSGVLELHPSGKKYISQVLQHLRNTLTALKKYHHELQRTVKGAMEMNDFTAAFANQEVIFFVASALVIFPLLFAWMFLSSYLSPDEKEVPVYFIEENRTVRRLRDG